MVSYVLDASAILRYLDGEAGADRVAEIIKLHIAGQDQVVVSAIHWGEVMGTTCKKHGMQTMDKVSDRLNAFGFDIELVTAERAVNSAIIKAQKGIPYADAFGVELAGDSSMHVLVTADFDVKPAENDVRIEFLPKKKK